ncbi:MAG: class I SAM-dependent methyltransferase [Methylobacteriaceae bacterium]|nr:class I SAM-dependent methyltransferase [Methylobacteriaceae bacterium]
MFIANFPLKSVIQKAVVFVRRTADYAHAHPYREMERRALCDTVEFIEHEAPDALAFDTPKELLRHAMRLAPEQGIVAEFGVNEGGTIRFIARTLRGRPVHGFDSFQGLPENWSGNNMAAGYFDHAGKLPKVPRNVTLHAGWFDKTLPDFVAANPGPVAFLHIDCDLYSSTKTIFDHLGERLVPGTIIVFDEYFNYPRWRHHEHNAFMELIESRRTGFEYLAYAFRQVAVAIR